jgi:hypothetical protein
MLRIVKQQIDRIRLPSVWPKYNESRFFLDYQKRLTGEHRGRSILSALSGSSINLATASADSEAPPINLSDTETRRAGVD